MDFFKTRPRRGSKLKKYWTPGKIVTESSHESLWSWFFHSWIWQFLFFHENQGKFQIVEKNGIVEFMNEKINSWGSHGVIPWRIFEEINIFWIWTPSWGEFWRNQFFDEKLKNWEKNGIVEFMHEKINSRRSHGMIPFRFFEEINIFLIWTPSWDEFWRNQVFRLEKLKTKLELSNSCTKKSTPEALMGWFRFDLSRRSTFF